MLRRILLPHLYPAIGAGAAIAFFQSIENFNTTLFTRGTYDTLTVIGKAILPEAGKPSDAAGAESSLAILTRWPVRISYFDKGKAGEGEQMPIYAISFELYENGISRHLALDYNDFVIAGEMTKLEMKKSSPCR